MQGTAPGFNFYQAPGREEWSPLMIRDWSATRSVTQVAVEMAEGRVHLRYWPNPTPAPIDPAHSLELPLEPGAASG